MSSLPFRILLVCYPPLHPVHRATFQTQCNCIHHIVPCLHKFWQIFTRPPSPCTATYCARRRTDDAQSVRAAISTPSQLSLTASMEQILHSIRRDSGYALQEHDSSAYVALNVRLNGPAHTPHRGASFIADALKRTSSADVRVPYAATPQQHI